MKQIIQNLKNGETTLEDVPAPLVRSGHLLIKTYRSLVSLGTEKMLIEFGKSNLISKALQQPERVRQVISKIKTEGLISTVETVLNKLDEPIPLGYSNAGEVIAIGEGVSCFKIGDRVVSNGPHAEYVVVPQNLCAQIPETVSYDEAAFTVVGAIALQGIRLAEPTFGETIVVVGLGLIGQLTAQILKANGCRVIGFDFDKAKVDLAKKNRIDAYVVNDETNVVQIAADLTGEKGADGVIITASTKSHEVISQSAQMCRKRGRIILVGVVGLNIDRADFYKKEITFQVSCSYGPGRYDEEYESKGRDYPYAYVRWTEKRNFEAVLAAIASGSLNVTTLVSARIPLDDYSKIYSNLGGSSIATIIEYADQNDLEQHSMSTSIPIKHSSHRRGVGGIGIIGAGNFTKMTLLPELKSLKADLRCIASASGITAKTLGTKYQFASCTSDYHHLLGDKSIDLVFITTRHNLHAEMSRDALRSNKHVLVEKPLALNKDELNSIVAAYHENSTPVSLNVGFNRRFSSYANKIKLLLGKESNVVNIVATMNAGYIPEDVWVHDLKVGGGRIIGEACHLVDLLIYFTGSHVKSVFMSSLGTSPLSTTDNASIVLKFENGSNGVINYFSNGDKSYSKERIEIYSQSRTLILDNFKKLTGYGFKNFSAMRSGHDKGHKKMLSLLIEGVKNGNAQIIPISELLNGSKATLACIESLTNGSVIYV